MLAGLIVGGGIGAAAHLYALSPVGRAVGMVQTHIALAADGHAEGSVAEHLDADALPLGTADVLLLDAPMDGSHLVEVEFAGQHYHIGKLGIELQRLDVGDVQLGAQVYLLTNAVAVGHHRHITGDNSRDTGLLGGIDDGVHLFDVLAIDDGVDREIRLDAMISTGLGDLMQVVDGEGIG